MFACELALRVIFLCQTHPKANIASGDEKDDEILPDKVTNVSSSFFYSLTLFVGCSIFR